MVLGYLTILKYDIAGGAGSDSQLVFFLTQTEARCGLGHNKCTDTFVLLGLVCGGKDNDTFSLVTVGDPGFCSIQNPVVPSIL